MIVLKMSLLALAHNAQARGDHTFAKRQDRSSQQDIGVLPNRLGEQGRELYNQGQQFGRQLGFVATKGEFNPLSIKTLTETRRQQLVIWNQKKLPKTELLHCSS
jgi:hypothetical protein